MATRYKGVRWCASIHVKGRFASEPERHVGAHGSAHGTFSLSIVVSFGTVAPVVITVNVATGQVHPRLFVFLGGDIRQGTTAALHAGKGQGVEPDGALRSGCVQFLPQGLQVLLGGGVEKPFSRAPEQCRSAQVNQRSILQYVTLTLHLNNTVRTYDNFYSNLKHDKLL